MTANQYNVLHVHNVLEFRQYTTRYLYNVNFSVATTVATLQC